jgi:hypothetical protein
LLATRRGTGDKPPLFPFTRLPCAARGSRLALGLSDRVAHIPHED